MNEPTLTPRMPSDSQHLMVAGQNGTGKTVASVWHLSHRSYTHQPWLIVDGKKDELIGQIPYLEEIAPGEEVPRHAGLYVVRPDFADYDREGALETTLQSALRNGQTGVYIDEASYIDKRSVAFNGILRTGRSLKVPLMALVQRPVDISRYLPSECRMFRVFDLADLRDRDVLANYTPIRNEHFDGLARFHSFYYDADLKALKTLPPVEPEDVILQRFEDRIAAARAANAPIAKPRSLLSRIFSFGE